MIERPLGGRARAVAGPVLARRLAGGLGIVGPGRVVGVGVGRGVRVAAEQHDAGDGRAHALLVGVGVGGAEDRLVGGGDGGDHVVESDALGGQPLAQEVDGELGGDLAGPVAAHAVGDDERAVDGQRVVLVARPDAAGIGRDAPADGGHYCASSTV